MTVLAQSAPPTATSGRALLTELERRLESAVEAFLGSRVWSVLSSPETSTGTVIAILRELHWEIHCYQPRTTKAGFHMIGGAAVEDMKVMRTLLLHKWDEVEHRAWAWECYLALGGDPGRSERLSPEAHAVCAVWESMAKMSALSYVGAEYLFEALTARLTPLVVNALRRHGLAAEGMRFIVDHAVEDQKHKNLFEHLIIEIGDAHPELHDDVLYAYDCFYAVYPAALWEGCLRRAEIPS